MSCGLRTAMMDWTIKVITERDAELMVAFDRIMEAGWDERHLSMQYCAFGRDGQAASIMLNAPALWDGPVELFRVTWEFDESGNNVLIVPTWIRPAPLNPTPAPDR